MKSFSERNQLVIGVVGLALTIGVVVGSLNYQRLPFLQGKEYAAYFADAGGLTTGEVDGETVFSGSISTFLRSSSMAGTDAATVATNALTDAEVLG